MHKLSKERGKLDLLELMCRADTTCVNSYTNFELYCKKNKLSIVKYIKKSIGHNCPLCPKELNRLF